jgi:hypothetical protein
MNKAFVREPEDDGRAYCPKCGALGSPVSAGPLDTYVRPESRGKLGSTAWFCSYGPCECAYFDQLGGLVTCEELLRPVYPKDLHAPLCSCFGFSAEDVEADVADGTPQRIRELLARSQTDEARCATLAPDGRNCMAEVRRLYMRLRG